MAGIAITRADSWAHASDAERNHDAAGPRVVVVIGLNGYS